MVAASLAFIGMNITAVKPDIGLTITLVAVFLNQKGNREDVFGDAPLLKRVLGETKILKNIKHIK